MEKGVIHHRIGSKQQANILKKVGSSNEISQKSDKFATIN